MDAKQQRAEEDSEELIKSEKGLTQGARGERSRQLRWHGGRHEAIGLGGLERRQTRVRRMGIEWVSTEEMAAK